MPKFFNYCLFMFNIVLFFPVVDSILMLSSTLIADMCAVTNCIFHPSDASLYVKQHCMKRHTLFNTLSRIPVKVPSIIQQVFVK